MRKLIIIIILTSLLTGCWNYIEINELSIITGLALDYENEQVVLTVEIAQPLRKAGKTLIASQIVQARGKNMIDAIRQLVKITGREAFWGHSKVVIFGKELMKNKKMFVSCIDYMKRSVKFRDNIWLVASEEQKAYDTMYAKKTVKNILSFQIQDTFSNQTKVSKYLRVQLYDFVDKLSTKGLSPMIPIIKFGDDNRVKIAGTCIFNGIDYTGDIDEDTTKYMLFLMDKMEGGLIVIDIGDDNEKVVLEVNGSDTKYKIDCEDNTISLDIDIKTVVVIANLNDDIDISLDSVQKKITDTAKEQILNECYKVVKLFQEKYCSDNLGFSYIIKKQDPKAWEKLQNDWNNIFSSMKINIKAEVNIKGSALRSGPIKVVK